MKMKSIITYKKWDVVLVPFPFTDLKALKKRPALVISPNDYNDEGMDIVLAFITSKMDSSARIGDYHLKRWKSAGLPKPSMIRMKLVTIDKNIIIKKIGSLTVKDKSDFKNLLIKFMAES